MPTTPSSETPKPTTIATVRISLGTVNTVLSSCALTQDPTTIAAIEQAKRLVQTAIDRLAEMEGWILKPRRNQAVRVLANEGWCVDGKGILRPLAADTLGFYRRAHDDGYHEVHTSAGLVTAYAVRTP